MAGPIKAANDYKQAADEAPATEAGLPGTPPELGRWLEEQVAQGFTDQAALEEFRRNNGIQSDRPMAAVDPALPPIPSFERSISETDWRDVYRAYAKSGIPSDIAAITGLDVDKIHHLINWGLRRLGLPPIREAAVDYAEVDIRVKKLTDPALHAEGEQRQKYLTHLAEAREAATERTAREAAAAQGSLIGSLQTADAFLGYVNQVLRRSQDPEGGYDIPEQISASLLEKLAKTASSLARAVDTAVRLSRFTAGEPERNITFEVAALVGRMSPDDLREYLRSGSIPSHLRIKTSNFIDVEFERTEEPPPAPPSLPPKEE